MDKRRIVVIGSGFAGLCAAGVLAKEGHDVTILEKNAEPGGRARTWKSDGFVFDMGPSWYWMPDVFEKYFNLFGKRTSDFYELVRLDPSYRVFFKDGKQADVPASVQALEQFFETHEPSSAKKLKRFLADAKYKYDTAMSDHIYRISDSVTEFFNWDLLIKSFRLRLFQSLRSEVRGLFKNPLLIHILEFPVLFLGSSADKTPSLYSMMNYADLVLGTWYPMGGMNQIVKAMVKIAEENGAKIICNEEVKEIRVTDVWARLVNGSKSAYPADVVVAGSDYHHTEQTLLPEQSRQYSDSYWNKRVLSPSSLLFFIGVNKKLPNLLHHNLFFDEDIELHASQIYSSPKWPTAPLFYVCVPSKTDAGVAPDGMENLFILMPLAAGLEDTPELREQYFEKLVKRIESKIGEPFSGNIVVKRSYCINDFKEDYHSYKGNAYGLANTLMQTAIFKPKMMSPKVKNLFYTGQLTVPGPGVPPSIISGQIAANEIKRRVAMGVL